MNKLITLTLITLITFNSKAKQCFLKSSSIKKGAKTFVTELQYFDDQEGKVKTCKYEIEKSDLTPKGQRPPEEILKCLKIVVVNYYDAEEKKVKTGRIVINKDLANDIYEIFQELLDQKFPITSIIPVRKSPFNWSDNRSMEKNNTSGYNFRTTPGSKTISWHALGRAIDINPRQNPYIKNSKVLPSNGEYNPGQPGTITARHPVVKAFKKRGWTWGGDWNSLKDYQHFQKAGLKQIRSLKGPFCISN